MPALGADMERGTLVRWLIKPGDRVAWQGRYALPPKDWASVRATIVADSEAGQ